MNSIVESSYFPEAGGELTILLFYWILSLSVETEAG